MSTEAINTRELVRAGGQHPLADFLRNSASVESSPSRLECIDPTSDPNWDRQVLLHPDAGPFHRSGWSSILQAAYGHRPFYARFTENGSAGIHVPLVEVSSWLTGKRGVSVPFADACDALVFRDSPTAFSSLCDLGRRRGWKHLELRGGSLVPKDATPSTQFWGHDLDLTLGVDELRRHFAPSVSRAIRKAEGSGLKIEHGTSIEAVRRYYQLHVRTRQRHGVPPQPWKFFANIQQSLLEKGEGFVTLAFQAETPIAGAVFFHAKSRAIYKFGASDLAFQSLRPANLVMANAIERLVSLGIQSLSFGRTSVANEGLRRFKLGWGAQESKLSYFRYNLKRSMWLSRPDRAHGRINAMFHFLPAILNRACGELLYPHLD